MENLNLQNMRLVIKYGGHALDDPRLARAFCANLLALAGAGAQLAVVHGGGPQIGRLLKRLGLESVFREGLRVTDRQTLEVVEMVLCGQVNKLVVREFLRAGLQGAGISGMDGRLFEARPISAELGRVGEITAVNPEIVECLLKGKFLPVIASLALDEEGEPLNINADTAAGALAGALGADYFVLVSDVPGVLDGSGKLLPQLAWTEVEKLVASKVISGGMLPKVRSCRNALDAGCKKAVIMDGAGQFNLERFRQTGELAGTVIF